jgi:uncharacterized protein YegP (UPF0339 family)
MMRWLKRWFTDAPEAPRLQVFKGVDAQWRYRTRAANGEIENTSEAYDSRWNACRAAKNLLDHPAKTMEILE